MEDFWLVVQAVYTIWQLGVWCFAQGHFDIQTGEAGAQTSCC